MSPMSSAAAMPRAPAAHRSACRCLACEAQRAAQLYGPRQRREALRRSRRFHKAVKAAEAQEADELALAERLSLCAFNAAESAVDKRFALDTQQACEASGQEHFLSGQPRLLQRMLTDPGLVLGRPEWLRSFLFHLWIGVPRSPTPIISGSSILFRLCAGGLRQEQLAAAMWGQLPKELKLKILCPCLSFLTVFAVFSDACRI